MRNTFLLLAVTVPSIAAADAPTRHAELLLGKNMAVLKLSTQEHDQLNDLGNAKQGVLRCYTTSSKIDDVGCYVGITRDGKLVAPAFLPKGKTGDASYALIAFAPELGGDYTASDVTPQPKGGKLPVGGSLADERVEIQIGGALGAAISLHTNCPSKGGLRCEDADGESYRHGKTNPVASFTVGAGGKIK
jgi:hypothetical protein